MRASASLSPRLYLHTLGCPKNDADSHVLARSLRSAGVNVVDDPDECTHVLINTCGFIRDAKEESIAAILQACARHGGERVLVMGCLVERYRQELAAGIPEVGGWFGLGQEDELIRHLQRARAGGATTDGAAAEEAASDDAAAGGAAEEDDPHGTAAGASYAYIKISDGCDEPCTFCAIPAIKGGYHSIDTATIMAEVDACLCEGARELVLVGQDTAIWRSGDLDLRGLLDLISADERVARVRVMYLQPEHVSDALLEYMAATPKVCRYLDIPLQHADGQMLTSMGRWGDGHAYRELIERARRFMPDVSLRSAFIVGFPGETEERFQTLLDFVDEVGFDHAGGFVYSPEEGTVGATLRPRVRKRTAIERLNRLTELLAMRAQERHGRLVGETLSVIIDAVGPFEEDEGDLPVAAIGRAEGQAPDVDGVTYIEGDLPGDIKPGDLIWVTMTDAVGHDMIGRWAERHDGSSDET